MELLAAFVRREVGVRYKETYAGVAWAVLQPLAYLAVFALLFGRLAKLPGSGPSAVLAALVAWGFISTAIVQASGSILNQLPVVSKIFFPRGVLPLAAVVASGADALIAFALQLLLLALFGPGLSPALLAWPALMVLTGAVCFGLALVLAPAMVRFRDLRYVLPLAIQLLLLASPVGYGLDAVPADLRGWYRVNPFAGLLDAFRSIGVRGELPPVVDLWPAVVWAAGLLVLGGLYFRRQDGTLADYA